MCWAFGQQQQPGDEIISNITHTSTSKDMVELILFTIKNKIYDAQNSNY